MADKRIGFKQWLQECGAEMPFDPKIKLKDANWQGAPGSPGKVIKGEPPKPKRK